MLFDRTNEENLKYGLEKSYHKSIVEAHAQQMAEINIVGTINLFYIEDVECNAAASGEYEITNSVKFDKFSLIKPHLSRSAAMMRASGADTPVSAALAATTNFLPIGRYFVRVKYRRVLFTNDAQLDALLNSSSRLEKESIVDLSLLPLAIRAQIVYEFGQRGTMSTHRTMNALAIDSHLLQIEINKKRDELIKEAIIKSSSPLETEALLMSASMAKSTPELEEFIKSLELDLNSYYICEKLSTVAELGNFREADLVKLNKLDALASFKCVQKYRGLLYNVIFPDKARKFPKRNSSTMINRLKLILVYVY